MSIDFIMRLVGMVAFAIGGIYLGAYLGDSAGGPAELWASVFALVGALMGLVISPFLTTRPVRAIRSMVAQLSAQAMLAALLGLIVGLVIAALISFPLSLLPAPFGQVFPFIAALLFGYLGVSIFIMRQNDILGMMRSRLSSGGGEEASGAAQGGRSILMDTSVIIDGRIADIARTGFISGPMLVPAFVLNELQHIADSPDGLRRQRGRRGLDILNRLQKDSSIPLRISDIDVEGVREVDDKLVILAKQLHSPVLTNDYNLNRVAELQGVVVLNINELANAVKAVYLPGESLAVDVIQEGKEVGQGVGYLDDGTMVVVESGREAIGRTVQATVTKVLQTAAGRMIFARPDDLQSVSEKEHRGMGLMVYNTLTRKKEPFETLEAGRVRMYVCGPTVYDRAHVGHAMSSVVFDVVRRYLEFRGYQVDHVMNYTDVEDKIIRRANEQGVEPLALAEHYLREYDRHLTELNVLPARAKPRASEVIGDILSMVQGLIDRGYAYALAGDVYFRVARDDDYGKLSRRRLEEMRAGTRLEIDERKEDPADFALWKAAKPGEPAWDSPWGRGRPGWHIECSAMNLHFLGQQIDIHGGGNDLVFPHHENEIAQSESFTGKPFARFWLHNGMLQLAGEKMSKSLGNLVTIDEFLAQHSADAFRMLILNSSYRGPLTFTEEVVQQAENALERLKGGLRPASASAAGAPQAGQELAERAAQATSGFLAAMDDDFNTSVALGHIFELVRQVNQARDRGATAVELSPAQEKLRELTGVLGLRLEERALPQQQAAPFVELLLELREELRVARQYALADRIRDRLGTLGVVLEDGKDGTTWRLR